MTTPATSLSTSLPDGSSPIDRATSLGSSQSSASVRPVVQRKYKTIMIKEYDDEDIEPMPAVDLTLEDLENIMKYQVEHEWDMYLEYKDQAYGAAGEGSHDLMTLW